MANFTQKQLLAMARAIATTAERERRDLTAPEIQRANSLLAQAEAMPESGATALAEARARPGSGLSAAARPATEGDGGSYMDIDARSMQDELERRTLRPDETFSQRVRGRAGWSEEEDGGYDLGDVLRAKFRGARTDREKRAMAVSSDVAGGFLLSDTVSAGVIDRLRPLNALLLAGAGMTDLEGMFTGYARVHSDATATSHAENQEMLASTVQFDLIRIIPRSVVTLVAPISTELLVSAPNLSEVVQGNIAKAMAQELDRQGLYGAGGVEMTGLSTLPGVTALSLGANGGQFQVYDTIQEARAALLTANAPEPDSCIMSIRENLTMALSKDNQGRPLQIPPAIQDVRYFASSKANITMKQGTATNASQLILGGFRNYVRFGFLLNMRLQLLVERYASQGAVGLIAYSMVDLIVTQPAGICVVSGVIPAA